MTQTFSAMPRWLRKVREWTARYLPAEVIGTLSAVVSAIAVFKTTGDRAAAAVVGAAAEGVGFYCPMAIREWRVQRANGPPQPLTTGVRMLRVMFREFGPAEALDSVMRPTCMYFSAFLVHGIGIGSLLGKFMADAVFYAVAIANYEMRKGRSKIATKNWRSSRATYSPPFDVTSSAAV